MDRLLEILWPAFLTMSIAAGVMFVIVGCAQMDSPARPLRRWISILLVSAIVCTFLCCYGARVNSLPTPCQCEKVNK